MKPIVSFTLFGNNPKYYVGAIKNTSDIKRLLPEWETRIYYRSDYVLTEYLEILADLGLT